MDEFESLNAANRISDWAAKEGGAALNVGDRILLGNAYLANPMSAESLLRAKRERKEFVSGVIANANSCGHVAIIESSTLKSTMPQFHLDYLKLVCARNAKPHRAKKKRTGETTDASEAESHAPWAVPAAAPAATYAVVPGPLAVPSNVQPPCLGILTQVGQQALVTARDGSEQFKGLSFGRLYAGCGTPAIRSIAVAVAALVPELFPLEFSRVFLDNIQFLLALSTSNGIQTTRVTEEALIAGLASRSFTTGAAIPTAAEVPALLSSIPDNALKANLKARARDHASVIVAAANVLLGAPDDRSTPVDLLETVVIRLGRDGHGTFEVLGTVGDVDPSSSVYTAVAAKRPAVADAGDGGQHPAPAVLIIKQSETSALDNAAGLGGEAHAKKVRALYTSYYAEAMMSMHIHDVKECIVVSTTANPPTPLTIRSP